MYQEKISGFTNIASILNGSFVTICHFSCLFELRQ